MTIDAYKKTIFNCLPRIISCCCRNPYSYSFGCFDRNFWHYKIVDTPSARLQEGILTLALLYLDRDSRFFQKEELRKWIFGGLRFWLKIQNSDGSFNEWYPREKSFVATAFSSYAISENLILLPDIEAKEEAIIGLKRAGNWLIGKRDRQAFNQNAGALAALYNIFILTGEEKYKKECRELTNFLKKNQNDEGWFPEYGGADIGYLSLAIDYLAKYYLKSKDESALPILEKGLSFLSNFIHPDGSAGGIYGSRNTAHIIPSGIEILAIFSPLASRISSVLRESIQNSCIIYPETLDDRYLIQNSYNYLEASRHFQQRSSFNEGSGAGLPSFSFEDKYFPQAGFLIKSAPNFYCIVNCKKGGAIYWYDRLNKKGIYNSGILLKRGEKSYSSSWLSEQNETTLSQDKKTILIKGRLKRIVDYRPGPLKYAVMRILLEMTYFIPGFTVLIKSALRNLLISQKTASSLYFERSFNFNSGLLVKDSFPPGIFNEGQTGGIQELIYIPSSRFFQNNLLYSEPRLLEREKLIQGKVEIKYGE